MPAPPSPAPRGKHETYIKREWVGYGICHQSHVPVAMGNPHAIRGVGMALHNRGISLLEIVLERQPPGAHAMLTHIEPHPYIYAGKCISRLSDCRGCSRAAPSPCLQDGTHSMGTDAVYPHRSMHLWEGWVMPPCRQGRNEKGSRQPSVETPRGGEGRGLA